MRKIITMIVLTCCGLSLQAQANNIDNMLLARYSKEELNVLKTNNPQEYEFAKYCVNNAFYIGATSKEKLLWSLKNMVKLK